MTDWTSNSSDSQDGIRNFAPNVKIDDRIHRFHEDCKEMGYLTADLRQFTKTVDDKKTTFVTDCVVRSAKTIRYKVQFSRGPISTADGVGFTFASTLPCPKDLKTITSMFLNKHGYVCIRSQNKIVKLTEHVWTLQIGDWIELAVDLQHGLASFTVIPVQNNPLAGYPMVMVNYREKVSEILADLPDANPVDLKCGYLSCVVRNPYTTLTVDSREA